jgi:poly(A) polymerase
MLEYEEINFKTDDTISLGNVLSFRGNSWINTTYEFDPPSKPVKYLHKFKLVTYNILSKFNFKKGLIDKRLSETNLEQVERMPHIIRILSQSSADFVLLQECEQYEMTKLCESEFIRDNYSILSANGSTNSVDGLAILSKHKPVFIKQLKFNKASSKLALVAKFSFRIDSLRLVYDIIVVNVHLTSNKAISSNDKRREQLQMLRDLLVDNKSDDFSLKCDYLIIAGDFNIMDESIEENRFIEYLFLNDGFRDLVPNVATFNATSNLSASITTARADKLQRYDRILLKSFQNSSKLEHLGSRLVGTAPFLIDSEQIDHVNIEHPPYLKIKAHTKQDFLNIVSNTKENKFEDEFNMKGIDYGEQFLHPSDHYGLEMTFRFPQSLSEENVAHKSTLAILIPKHVCEELIDPIRMKYDPQVERWPPHINLLYPFYENIEIDTNRDQVASLMGDILAAMNKLNPFECDLNKINQFERNNVVFLEPGSGETKTKMQGIYKELKSLFSDSGNSIWRDSLTPHCTIAQPVNKSKAEKNWSKNTLQKITKEFDLTKLSVKFTIDSIYWMTRTETMPFKIRQAFPLGFRYPSPAVNLNPRDLSTNTILKFMDDRKIITESNQMKLQEMFYEEIVDSVVSAISQLNPKVQKTNSDLLITELKDKVSGVNYGLVPVGSFLFSVACHDLDICLIRKMNKHNEGDSSEFSKSLTLQVAQNDKSFRIVRDVSDALVPIIEICFKTNAKTDKAGLESTDIQIHNVPFDLIDKESHFFYDNFSFMSNLSKLYNEEDYKKLYPISGLFENQSLKKHIPNFKDFQVLVSFVKCWANARHVYGKAFGFLGGISWTIMVIYFLNKTKDVEWSRLENSSSRFSRLVELFFAFYSKFTWTEPVSLINTQFVTDFTWKYQKKSPVMILQSVFPYHNTSKNVTDKSRQILRHEIDRAKNLFARKDADDYGVYERVCNKLELNDFCDSNRMVFRVYLESSEDLPHVFSLMKSKVQGMVTLLERNTSGLEFRPLTSLIKSDRDEKNLFYYLISLGSVSLSENQKRIIDESASSFIKSVLSKSHTSGVRIDFELL